MRTTLAIEDALLRAARERAAEAGTTLTSFVEHALAAALAERPTDSGRYCFKWQTHSGRVLPGVDVSDRDRLYELMDQSE